MAEEKAAIPKFASFRPKVAPPPAATTKEEQQKDRKNEQDTDRNKDAHRSRKHSRDHEGRRRQDARHREHYHRHGPDRDRSRDGRVNATTAPTDADAMRQELFENASNLYRLDLKGDPDNLRYRKLHSYSVPGYRRIGFGAVLGAHPKEKIDRAVPEDQGVVLVVRERNHEASRGLLQRQRTKEQRHLRLIKPDVSRGHNEHEMGFIQLPPSRKRKRRSESPIPENGEVDYRSIEGKAKPAQQPENSDLEYGSSSDDQGVDSDTNRAARLKAAELTRRTREQPQDLAAWRELIEHQRSVLGFSSLDFDIAKTRTLADVRISIYEQALEIVKPPSSRAALTLGMLEEGAKFWEAKSLAKKWEEALRSFSNDSTIWTAYLNFLQGSHAEFRYERCRDEYIRCLAILGQELQRTSSPAPEISRNLIYVFLRLTNLMRDAGYHEFAYALWQCILELHFFRPAGVQGADAIYDAFEEFWESEVPRLGEVDARGWLNFSPDEQDAPEPVMIEIDTVTSTRRLFSKFAGAEEKAAKQLAQPGRSADDAGEDDPYHIVLFNDLKPVLFPHLLHIEHRSDLVAGLLRFLGLPPPPWSLTREYEYWWLDPMLSRQDMSNNFIPHFQTTTNTLFDQSFALLNTEGSEWAQRVLQSLVDACPQDDVLAEYLVALLYHSDASKAAKFAKRLLKMRSSCLQLYNCYAIMECRSKGLETGGRIFSTAIGMADTLGEHERRLKVLLYRTWIWEAMHLDDNQAAISVLLSIGGSAELTHDQTFMPAVELRITRWLRDGRDAMLLANDTHLAMLHAELLALVAYFRHQRSIQAAFAVYDDTDELIVARGLAGSPAREHLHQAQAQLIAFHLKSVHIWQPALIRATLSNSIKLFPNNTIFLTAYSSVGPDLSLHGSHSLIQDTTLAEGKDTIVGWSFALQSTQQRDLDLGGTVHFVRATFERAVSRAAKHNIHIWTAYLLFECDQQDFRRARDVFLRGLRELPWAKWWVVLGLQKLADVMGFEEGRRVWMVLGERELRVHVDVEELVSEEWEKRVKEREGNVNE